MFMRCSCRELLPPLYARCVSGRREERRRHGIDEQHTMLSLFASAASLLPTRIEPRLTRRSACALAALANLPAPPQAAALYEGRLTVPAKMDEAMEYLMKYTQTPSGLLYFDAPRGSGFDEVPCRRGCLQRKWAVDPSVTAWAAPSGPILNDVGKTVRIDYRVRRGFFDDEPVALSDGTTAALCAGGCYTVVPCIRERL